MQISLCTGRHARLGQIHRGQAPGSSGSGCRSLTWTTSWNRCCDDQHPPVFEAEGEARFRDIEAQVLAEVTARPGGMVLSTGGGAVLRPETARCCAILAMCCICGPRPEEIFKRVKHDRTSPPLQVNNPCKTARVVCPARCAVPRSSHLRDRNRLYHGADAGQHDHDAAGDGAPRPRQQAPQKHYQTIAGCASDGR